MSKKTVLLLLGPLVAAMSVTACSGGDTPVLAPAPSSSTPPSPGPSVVPTGEAGIPRGGAIDPATVDPGDPDQVADAVVTTMETVDTRIDKHPMDASRRAAPWLSVQYLDQVSEPVPGGGGAQWLELEKHDGYTTTTVSDATEMGQPEDTATEAFRARATLTEQLGAGGWTGEPTQYVYYVYLIRDSATDPWVVNAVAVG